jgi:hypothetical protein
MSIPALLTIGTERRTPRVSRMSATCQATVARRLDASTVARTLGCRETANTAATTIGMLTSLTGMLCVCG